MTDIFKWWVSLNDFWKKSIAVHIELMKMGVQYDEIIESTKAICNEVIEEIYKNISGNTFVMPSVIEFEKALNLSFLYVRSVDCDVTDIQPLALLGQLEIIDFSFNNVSNLSPIQNCKNLKILNFESNQVSSLEPIENLNNLIELNFSRNKVSNLSPLKGKVWLTILKSNQNPIKSLTGIQDLARLEYFDCSDDTGVCRIGIEDLNSLVKFKRLKRLKLDSPLFWNEVSLYRNVKGQTVREILESMFVNCEITY